MKTTYAYAIGEQDFANLRKDDCLYIDKTMYIEKILLQKNRYYFLARPRRFGKSLFLSTLQYFFEGRRDLFKGLYIDSIAWDWTSYPVLHLDLNRERYLNTMTLEEVLEKNFREWEAKFGIEQLDTNPALRLGTIIAEAHRRTGKQVVILVDEYDKPLVSNLNVKENFDHDRVLLATLYSNFKSSAEHIRLVFLTGVSRFSRLSIFSDLNNLNDISFDNEFADICGITEKELLRDLRPGIEALADKKKISFEEACHLLKRTYDGYRFAEDGSDIYNPWSLLSCMQKQRVGQFWNQTGLPTVIAEVLRKANMDLERVFNSRCPLDTLAGMDLTNPDPTALMYQTGYLTIKNYDSSTDIVTLGIPNEEVSKGLFHSSETYRYGSPGRGPHIIRPYGYSYRNP